jgi:hypothetical protein
MSELIPDGIHFGLDEQAYHDDPALGYSDHKGLLVNPVQWRFKRDAAMREALGLGDPADKPEETVAMSFGKAVDCMILTPERFDDRYTAEPEPPEGTLWTIAQIREALGARCMLPKGASLADHQMDAKRFGLTNLGCDWEADKDVLIAGRQVLSKRWIATMRLINRMMDAPRADYEGKSLREAILTDGYPQVAVFWTDETGLRLKMLVDYLRPAAMIDLKTYAGRDDLDVADAFWGSVTRFGYDMQAAHYLEGGEQIGRLVSEGRVFGDHDPAWVQRFVVRTKRQAWVWLGVQWVGMPEVDEFRFPEELIFASAGAMVREARAKYRDFAARFGTAEPWVSMRGPIVLSDETCPHRIRITERGAQRWKPL